MTNYYEKTGALLEPPIEKLMAENSAVNMAEIDID